MDAGRVEVAPSGQRQVRGAGRGGPSAQFKAPRHLAHLDRIGAETGADFEDVFQGEALQADAPLRTGQRPRDRAAPAGPGRGPGGVGELGRGDGSARQRAGGMRRTAHASSTLASMSSPKSLSERSSSASERIVRSSLFKTAAAAGAKLLLRRTSTRSFTAAGNGHKPQKHGAAPELARHRWNAGGTAVACVRTISVDAGQQNVQRFRWKTGAREVQPGQCRGRREKLIQGGWDADGLLAKLVAGQVQVDQGGDAAAHEGTKHACSMPFPRRFVARSCTVSNAAPGGWLGRNNSRGATTGTDGLSRLAPVLLSLRCRSWLV